MHTEYQAVGDQKTEHIRFAHRILRCRRPEDGTNSFCTQHVMLSETRRWDTFVLLTISCSFVSSLAPAAAVHAPFCAFLSNSDASVRKREEVRALNLGRASWKTAPCLIKPLPPTASDYSIVPIAMDRLESICHGRTRPRGRRPGIIKARGLVVALFDLSPE